MSQYTEWIESEFLTGTYSKGEIEAEIEELTDRITILKADIFGLICGDPTKLLELKDVEGYSMDAIDVASQRFFGQGGLMSELEEDILRKAKLERCLDNWDNVFGDFIENKNIKFQYQKNGLTKVTANLNL